MSSPTYEELLAENARLADEKRALADEKQALTDEKRALTDKAKLQALFIDRLQEQVKSLLAQRYGRRSEKLSVEELGQLVLAYGGDPNDAEPEIPRVEEEPDTDAADEPPADEPQRPKPPRYKNGHPGRSPLSDELERVTHEHDVPAEERACVRCHQEMTPIRHVDHERVEYVPAKLVVHIDRREVLACRRPQCKGDATTAEREPVVAPRCRLGMSLLAHLIEAKCQDAQPIERQRDQLARLGFEIPVNTLYSGWNRSLDMLRIVSDTVVGEILAEWYVRIDDTGLSVLDRHRKGGQRRGHLWCMVGHSGRVGYHFTETWRADEIAPVIEQVKGFAQVDDWKGYGSTIVDKEGTKRPLIPPDRRLGCGMHTRRRFHEDHKLGGKKSAPALIYWRDLYAIEAYAKSEGFEPEQRHKLRQEKSVPIMDAFDAWVDETITSARPKSRLGKALNYAQQQRPYLRRCLTDGRFEIDNGEPERQIRKPAIGRNNWLFTGSNAGGRRLATAYTLVQTCRTLNIPIAEYLQDVMSKIESGWPARRLCELTPDRWAAARSDS